QVRLFAFSGAAIAAADVTPEWKGKLKATDPADRAQLSASFIPALTATGEAGARPDDQIACYVALLLMDGPAPKSSDNTQPASDGSSFERLCTLIGAWVGASVQSGSDIPLSTVYDSLVSESDL